ncbi:amidase [Nocardia nepalensis]|uniref:amidase n=1 Tax=Nocardia nepalensis TaxID=3375448 RepID=UPI003B67106A
MKLDEYAALDATALAELIGRGEVTRTEVLDVARSAVIGVDSALGAVVGPIFNEALAHSSVGPLSGVPFALKDLLCTAAGVPSEGGSRALAGNVASADSDLMKRWRAAGLAVICRSAVPEFGFSASTEPAANGPCKNPWNLERVAGGSSGGAAALVASGALPVAHGNDAGGSIRIPAALCGLVGLKPTRGLVPPGPDFDEPLFGLTTEFALTRTVRDAALLLDSVHGSAEGDRYHLRRWASGTFSRAAGMRPRGLRIAVWTATPEGVADTQSDVAAEVERVGRALEQLGHRIDWATPDIDHERLKQLTLTFWSASIADTARALAVGGQISDVLAAFEGTTAAMVRHGLPLSWAEVSKARAYQNELTRRMGRFLRTFDLLLTPTTRTVAWPVGELNADRHDLTAAAWVDTLADYGSFTALHNVTGQPAISVPTGATADGLPIGVQLAAAPGREDLLLGIAAQLEELDRWSLRRPAVHAATLDSEGAQLAPRPERLTR